MKKKVKIVLYFGIILLLVHLILVVGCGRNPLISLVGSPMIVGVGRM